MPQDNMPQDNMPQDNMPQDRLTGDASASSASSAPRPADVVLCGRVVTMDRTERVLADGAVAVVANRIVAVGDRSEITSAHIGKRVVAGPDAIILPGFSDCHTHSTQSLVRGLIAGELPMIARIYRPADAILSPEEAHLASKLCAAQLVLSGVTSVCDFATGWTPAHEDAIIAAHAEVGLRCILLRGRSDQLSHHAALYAQERGRSSGKVAEGAAERDLLRTEELLKRARATPDGLFQAGVCPSSLLGFSEHYFRAGHALAAAYDATLQVHAARDREEVEFCLAMYGCRPIERLAELGVVDDRLVVVHGQLASDGEIALLGKARANLVHSAVESVNLLNRIPSLSRMLRAGINLGLGCDNAANDIFAVMHTAWAMQVGLHGLENYEPNCVTELELLRMATSAAARLLRQDRFTGSIEVGKMADLVVIDGSAPHLFPTQDLATELVRYAGRGNVRHVLVAGRFVVEDFRNATVDVGELARAIAPVAARVGPLLRERRYQPLPRFGGRHPGRD
jgi:5-methylthioadenosine/S-adenosylhomocysteine deaminase